MINIMTYLGDVLHPRRNLKSKIREIFFRVVAFLGRGRKWKSTKIYFTAMVSNLFLNCPVLNYTTHYRTDIYTSLYDIFFVIYSVKIKPFVFS